MKKNLLIIALMLLGSVKIFASQITIQLVQHNSCLNQVSNQTLIVEDEILNGFFDYGCIVTNTEAKNSDSNEKDEDFFSDGFAEAFDGSSDYFVQIKVYYDGINKGSEAPYKLSKIDWKMMDVRTGNIVKESSIQGVESKKGIDDSIHLASALLIKDIKKAL